MVNVMENPSGSETGKWAGHFFTIWTGQALSLFGSALVQFALIWWLTQKSGSATVLAIGVVQIWHVYAIMAVRALGGAFHFPAMSASTRMMVPEKQLTRIGGLNQALQGINSLAAPPLGALLLGFLQTQNILLIDVATAMLAIIPLLFIPIPQPKRHTVAQQGVKTSLMQDIRE